MDIYCFSGSGYSRRLAEYFSKRLGVGITDIEKASGAQTDTAVIVFPVYCQNTPTPVKAFLKRLSAERAVLAAVYGGIHHGNVLWEAARITNAQIIGAAYVPTGHSFLNENKTYDVGALEPLLERIAHPAPAMIPKQKKQLYADVFPAWRSRKGISLVKNDCCTDCGLCTRVCPMGAMRNGEPDNRCIRCLRCVADCPQKALETELSQVLVRYFASHSERKKETEIYL